MQTHLCVDTLSPSAGGDGSTAGEGTIPHSDNPLATNVRDWQLQPLECVLPDVPGPDNLLLRPWLMVHHFNPRCAGRQLNCSLHTISIVCSETKCYCNCEPGWASDMAMMKNPQVTGVQPLQCTDRVDPNERSRYNSTVDTLGANDEGLFAFEWVSHARPDQRWLKLRL